MTIQWHRPTPESEARARRRAFATAMGMVTGFLIICALVSTAAVTFYLREAESASVRLSPRDWRVGECFGALPEGGVLEAAPVVPCNEPHLYETYGRIPIYAGNVEESYPGDAYISNYADSQCRFAFESYVGVPAARAPLSRSIIKPDAADWGRGRREVVCVLSSDDGGELSFSQRNNRTITAQIDIMAATEGECLLAPEVGSDNLVTGLAQSVACGQPHDLEVYAVIYVPGDTYPGAQELAATADAQCIHEFELYVGIPENQSSLGYDSYFPSEPRWNSGERTIVCALLSENGEKIRGSMRDTGAATQNAIAVGSLDLGDCFDHTSESFSLTGSVIKRACTEPHLRELFYTEELAAPAADFPDEETLAAADERCIASFADYVGLDYSASTLDIYALSPNPDEWTHGERTYLCFLFDREHTLLESSMRATGEVTTWQNRYPDAELISGAELSVGDCLVLPKHQGTPFPLVTLPCDVIHHREVFAQIRATPPADAAETEFVNAEGVQACAPYFEPYVGASYEEGELGIALFAPEGEGERLLSCLIYLDDPQNYLLSASVRGSGVLSATPTAPAGERIPLTNLTPGDCLSFPPGFEQRADVLTVPCDSEHEQEVFAIGDFDAPPDSPYPDFAAVDGYAQELCESAFEGYVGIPYRRSTLDYTYLGLSSEAWERGERRMVCTLMDSTFNPLTTSMRDSGALTAFPPDTVPNAVRVALRELPAESCYYQPVDFYKSGEVLQVPCAAPHAQELYAIVDYPDAADPAAPYPDFAALADFADNACRAAFADYLGVPFGESSLGYTADHPDEREWRNGDRRAFCLLFGYNFEEFEGLLKGSGR